MKKICIAIIAFLIVIGTCSCSGQKNSAEWQEQYDLGVRYLSEGNYEEAIIAFTAAIEIDPKKPDTYIGLYEAYVAVGDYESAQAAIDSGREECGNRAEFDNAQNSLDRLFSDDPEMQMYIDSEKLSEALRSGVLTFDDLPLVFNTPFNQLGSIVGLTPGDIRMTTQSGGFNGIEYDNLELQECAYDYEPDHLYGWWIRATAPATGSDTLDFTIDNSNAFLNGEDLSNVARIPAGWKDIAIGDSMDTVLSKLGLDATLSKYSSIDLWIARDETKSNAWVDLEAWNFTGDIPIVRISVQFGSGSDYSDIDYYVGFDFVDGGPLSAIRYSNYMVYDALLNGRYEGGHDNQANGASQDTSSPDIDSGDDLSNSTPSPDNVEQAPIDSAQTNNELTNEVATGPRTERVELSSGYMIYEYNADGILVTKTSYTQSGQLSAIHECDLAGNSIKVTGYRKDGSVYWFYTQEFDANNNLVKKTMYHDDGTLNTVSEYDTLGNLICETEYDSDGTINFVTEYASNGLITNRTEYRNDGSVYAVFDYDDDGNNICRTDYFPNGMINAVTRYDSNGKQIEKIIYAEDGSYTVYE